MKEIKTLGFLIKRDHGWYLENLPNTLHRFSFKASRLKPNTRNFTIKIKVYKVVNNKSQ